MAHSTILSVETQVRYPDAGCRPDIRLTLANGRIILCENKIEAIETAGKDETKRQIDRYLELPVDGVVYIRGSWDPPAKKVIENPKYTRPSIREHFLVCSEIGQLTNLSTTITPLLPIAHTHLTTHPVGYFRYRSIIRRYPEIAHTASPKVFGQFGQTVFPRDAPARTGQLFHSPSRFTKSLFTAS